LPAPSTLVAMVTNPRLRTCNTRDRTAVSPGARSTGKLRRPARVPYASWATTRTRPRRPRAGSAVTRTKSSGTSLASNTLPKRGESTTTTGWANARPPSPAIRTASMMARAAAAAPRVSLAFMTLGVAGHGHTPTRTANRSVPLQWTYAGGPWVVKGTTCRMTPPHRRRVVCPPGTHRLTLLADEGASRVCRLHSARVQVRHRRRSPAPQATAGAAGARGPAWPRRRRARGQRRARHPRPRALARRRDRQRSAADAVRVGAPGGRRRLHRRHPRGRPAPCHGPPHPLSPRAASRAFGGAQPRAGGRARGGGRPPCRRRPP